VREQVVAIPLPSPPAAFVAYTLAYLINDDRDGIHLIDPGYATPEARTALERALDGLGCSLRDLRSVIVTHLHPDHIGQAASLRTETGARVVLSLAEQRAIGDFDTRRRHIDPSWGVPTDVEEDLQAFMERAVPEIDLQADVVLDDGEILDVPGHPLLAIHTPGHTVGQMCLRSVEDGVLFTGDHVLPKVHPGIGLGGRSDGNPMADYLDSLEKVARYDDDEVLPGHEYRFVGLAERCAAIAAHHRRRTAAAAALLEQAPDLSVWEATQRIGWSAGFAALAGDRLVSALAQTAMHLDLVRRGL
jgi:glyoxylase-like metal-dependent hydrolase (beta-lactamase superfamily II)